MQDQRTVRDVAAELDRAERLVLDELLTSRGPGLWTAHELGLALGSQVEATDAVAGLGRAGLIHRCGEFVFPTRAAARMDELQEADC
jgi:hypothetical protein